MEGYECEPWTAQKGHIKTILLCVLMWLIADSPLEKTLLHHGCPTEGTL